jgi:hypothetical protein
VSTKHWLTSDVSVASDATGSFVVVWWHIPAQGSNERDVFGRRYESAGEPLGVEFRVNSYTTNHQQVPAVAAAGNDQFVVAWESAAQDGGSRGIFGQRFGFSGDMRAIHVGDLDGRAKDVGANWLARLKTLVHDDGHRPISGALVTLYVARVGSRTCTTTGAGQCEVSVVVSDSEPNLTFTVTNLTKAGVTYSPATNHDPDPDSNGTVIVVSQP